MGRGHGVGPKRAVGPSVAEGLVFNPRHREDVADEAEMEVTVGASKAHFPDVGTVHGHLSEETSDSVGRMATHVATHTLGQNRRNDRGRHLLVAYPHGQELAVKQDSPRRGDRRRIGYGSCWRPQTGRSHRPETGRSATFGGCRSRPAPICYTEGAGRQRTRFCELTEGFPEAS
jgi:hypothetical protein